MIKTIAHLADIHVPKSLERHEEYKQIFNKLYPILEEKKPDRIVIAGDTYNDYIDLEGEALIIIGNFLNKLSKIAPVVIIKGNHEVRKKNRSRIDTVKTLTSLLGNSAITYYDKTGFYNDDNVVWAVWDYLDKTSPWKTIPLKKDKSKIYIDLFHDQINGCKFYSGFNPGLGSYPKPDEFKGDYSFFGDIHLRQFFGKTKAFPGSLVQKDFGEDPFDHGFLFWDIETGNVEEINILNDYVSIKFTINPGQDYDKLKLNSKYISVYNKFRVEWSDYAANVTNENEKKIRKYIKDKYNVTDVEILKNSLYTDIKDGKMLSEIIDINDKAIQQNIIKEYLKLNKFETSFIDEIIELDNLINERLQLSDTKNVIWNIDKFWFSNFKSYGDNNIVDWDKISGVVQISGINQQGKTSILDAICFILYGTTLSTTKDEKNGNNRYINRHRKSNTCEGGCVLDVNGEKYIIQRKVERDVKKGIIKSVPMTLDYYKGIEINEDTKQTGENKIRTQQLLDDVLGDFQDFVRMALTNADNLNQLLSINRSVFIDSVVKDAGYDIFEKKLKEFKEYKDELKLEKINLNETDVETQITRIKGDLEDKENYVSDINIELAEIEKDVIEKNSSKEDCLRRLHKIDESVLNIDMESVKKKIKESKVLKNSLDSEMILLEEEIFPLPKVFDDVIYEKYITQNEKYISEKNKTDIKLIQLNNIYVQNESKINSVDRDINIEKTKYIDYLRNNVAGLRVELKDVINEINNSSNIKKYNIENEKTKFKNELNVLKQNILDEKKKISSYTDMLNGNNQICVTCNQPITNKDEEHMNSLILESTNKISEFGKSGKSLIEKINDCSEKTIELDKLTEDLIISKKDEYSEKIKVIQNKIDNFNVTLIQDKISEVMSNKEIAEKANETLVVNIKERKLFQERLDSEIKKISLKISTMKLEKSLYEKFKELSHKKEILNSRIKDAERNYEDGVKLINEYSKNESSIKENDILNVKIIELGESIETLSNRKNELLDDKMTYSNEIILSKKVVEDLETKLVKYKEQCLLEEKHNVYIKLMHRSGLPTYLLTKNIDLLNKELSNLLYNTDFILFFDEELNLKLRHNGRDSEINAIESSGYERTMCAIVLKIVLRLINFKSKPNIMFFDEILNRLVGKSVDKFMELLETLKTKLDKIVIIEHNNEIHSDLIINVTKDENGISSFELI